MKKTIAIILSALLIIGTVSIAAVSAASGTKIVLNGTTYECGEGDTITYTINMTTPEVIENGQFIIYYPSSLLSVSNIKFDSILGFPTVNYTENVTDEIDFNFSKYDGYDFTTKHLLIEVSFIVKSAGNGEISLDRSASNMFILNLNDVNIKNSVTFEEILGNVTKIDDSTSTDCSISSTNNVASTQTVTLFMYSDTGISGYYWGKNPNYRSNTYTSSSSTSVTKTVSESGTYYLTVKDTSGNISSTQSIRFCETTLNANGGKVSNKKILTLINTKITLPTPTKSGYTFVGWSTISSSDIGVKTITPISNSTYYAIWKKDSINPNVSTGKDSGHEILSEKDKKKTQKISAKSYTKTYGNVKV